MKKINAKHGIVMNNPDSIFNYFGWPSVTKLPDGTLAAVASGYRLGHVCPFGKSVISYSRDEGKTWTRPAPVIDTPLDDRDSGITCIGGNRVMINSFNNSTAQQRGWANQYLEEPLSDEKRAVKALWLAYCELVDSTGLEEKYLGATYVISEDGGYTFGEVKKLPVPLAAIHGPCVTPYGEVLYIGYNVSPEKEGTSIECWKMVDDDNFEFVGRIQRAEEDDGTYGYYEPHSVVLPDGTIIVMIRVYFPNRERDESTFCSISIDGGKTFTKPVDTKCDGLPCHIMRHSSGVLIGTYGYRNKPYGQRVMFSFDNGKTWDIDYVLRDDGPSTDLGYPCTVELDNGSLLTVYYQREQGCENAIIMQSKWSLDGLFDKE